MEDLDLDKLLQFLLDKKLVQEKAVAKKVKDRLRKDKKAAPRAI